MDSSPTLQNFVLNLIYDPAARSAFEADPHGSLQDAGLGDVTAADVHDVLPLVLDYAPLGNTVHSLDNLSQVDDLTTGVAHLDVAGAAAHLQTIVAQIGGPASAVTGGDLNVTAAGAVTVSADHLISGALHGGLDLPGVGHPGLGHTGLGLDVLHLGGAEVGAGAGLTAGHDPAVGLDAAAGTPVGHAAAGVGYGADGLASHASLATAGALDSTVNTVTGVTGSLGLDSTVHTVTGVTGSIGLDGSHGLDVAGVHQATSSIVGSLTGSGTTGGLLPDGSGVHSTIAGVQHHVSGLTGAVGELTHPTPPEGDHDLLGGLTGLHF